MTWNGPFTSTRYIMLYIHGNHLQTVRVWLHQPRQPGSSSSCLHYTPLGASKHSPYIGLMFMFAWHQFVTSVQQGCNWHFCQNWIIVVLVSHTIYLVSANMLYLHWQYLCLCGGPGQQSCIYGAFGKVCATKLYLPHTTLLHLEHFNNGDQNWSKPHKHWCQCLDNQ